MSITRCGHSYCSLCIRRSLGSSKRCPTCGIECSEGDLLNSRALDHTVRLFCAARDTLLEATAALCAPKPVTVETGVSPATPVKRVRSSATPPASAGASASVSASPESSRSRVSTRRATKRPSPRSLSDDEYEEKEAQRHDEEGIGGKDDEDEEEGGSSGDDDDFVPSRSATPQQKKKGKGRGEPMKKRARKNANDIVVTVADTDDTTEAAATADGGPCPICNTFVPASLINAHLDDCLSRGEQKDALRSTKPSKPAKQAQLTTATGPRKRSPTSASVGRTTLFPTLDPFTTTATATTAPVRRKLPKKAYHVLKPKQLKDLLAEAGLSTTGDRLLMEWRHREYVLRYNAECDCARPRPLSAIRDDVRHAEVLHRATTASAVSAASTVGVGIGGGASASSGAKKLSEAQVEERNRHVLAQNKSTFAKLTEEIRERQRAAKARAEEEKRKKEEEEVKKEKAGDCEGNGKEEEEVEEEAASVTGQRRRQRCVDDDFSNDSVECAAVCGSSVERGCEESFVIGGMMNEEPHRSVVGEEEAQREQVEERVSEEEEENGNDEDGNEEEELAQSPLLIAGSLLGSCSAARDEPETDLYLPSPVF